MMSLKAFGPILAGKLGTTPAAIYERQRALVRQGLLPAPVGRGRGNGLPATAETVAMIIIAMMVTDNLSDTDSRVRRLAYAKVNDDHQGHCGLTGKRDFKSALAAILGSQEHLRRILWVVVYRNVLTAEIMFRLDRNRSTEFGNVRSDDGIFEITAEIDHTLMQSIGTALQRHSEGK